MIDANFRKGPGQFLQGRARTGPARRGVDGPPPPAQDVARPGNRRHSADEITAIGIRSIDAMAAYLGDKPFFMGNTPVGIDATMFAFAVSAICPLFESDLQRAAVSHEICGGMSAG